MHDVIIKPIISEKSMALANKSTFTFLVALSATKKEIKQAVEKLFQVNVTSVATNIVKGKRQRNGKRRTEVVNTPEKKAMVTLKDGQKIDAFEIGA